MKVHSLTILHYGADYLSYALRSVYHSVEACHVFYTPTPSHGHQTNTPPIETKEQLVQAAYAYDPDKKIKWYDMTGVTHEGPQRDLALQTVQAAGADLVVVVDCDEVWRGEQLDSLINHVWSTGDHRIHCVNMRHFWRSFNWVCRDDGWPARIIDLRQGQGPDDYVSRDLAQVYHFGYAIRDAIMTYKWQIHGHKNELRLGWLDNTWTHWPPIYPNADGVATYPGDHSFCCHPTNEGNFWEPEPFDRAQLPAFMRAHPFYDLEMIR